MWRRRAWSWREAALDKVEGGEGARLLLPLDLVLGDRFDSGADRRELDGTEVPDGWMGLDVGPRTAEAYGREVAAAGTVFWNGPMGAFEMEPFAGGTRDGGRSRGRGLPPRRWWAAATPPRRWPRSAWPTA